MCYWLVKTEPEEYSFEDLLRDGKTVWNGVRNYQARNNLKKMKKGDKVLIYHSGKDKEIVGIAEVVKEFYKDPEDKTNTWVVVEITPVKKLRKTIKLDEIKKIKQLSSMQLLKQSRLSVMLVTSAEYDLITNRS